MAGIPRQTQFQQTHFLRRTVNYNDSGIATGIVIGTLPAGALLGTCRIWIQTAFNAATTNVLNVGTTGAGSDIIATAQAAPTATGRKTGTAVDSIATPFAADQDIYVSYTQSGTPATAGVATIVIDYIPNSDR